MDAVQKERFEMATIKFELVSPERVIVSANVEHVVLPGSEGELGVLPGHAPAVVTLKPGVVSVLTGGTASQRLFVNGGFAEINPESVTVLAERAFDPANTEKSVISDALAMAEKALADANNDDERFVAQAAIDTLRGFAA